MAQKKKATCHHDISLKKFSCMEKIVGFNIIIDES